MFIQGRSLRSLPSVNLMTIAVKVQKQAHDNIYDHMWSSARCIWDLEAGMQHTVCRCQCRVCRRWSRVCSAGYAAAAAAAGAPDRGAPAGDKFGAEAPGGRLLLLVLPPPAQSRPADFWLSRYSREWFHKFEAEARPSPCLTGAPWQTFHFHLKCISRVRYSKIYNHVQQK